MDSVITQRNAGPWAPLASPVFRWLWLASIASNIGTWMHEVGAGWLMTSLSASPLAVAMVQVAGALPMFFLALPAGALADIVDKRRYLLWVQAWMACVALTLAVLTLTGWMSVPVLLILTLCMGIGTALMMPAWSAVTPEVVAKDALPAAIALSSLGVNVARAIGPALAGFLVSLSGPWLTFALNAVSFVAVMVALYCWKTEVATPLLPAERLMGAIRAGFRYARSAQPLQAVLLRTAAFFIGASAGMALLPILVRKELLGTAADFGVLLGCVGLGAVGGAMVLPKLRRGLSNSTIVALASCAYACVLFALAGVRDFAALIPVMLVSGAAWIAVLSSLQVAAQTAVPTWVRARALAVYILVFFGCSALGGIVWGAVASHWSLSVALTAGGAFLLIGVLATLAVKLPVTAADDLAPSMHWPAPVLDEHYDCDRGPVMVTIDYDIPLENSEVFRRAMQFVGGMRRRNGSLSWGLMQDSENPRLWHEFFFDESWLDHLRHHGRVTRAEQRIEAAARQYMTPGTEVRIRHYLGKPA